MRVLFYFSFVCLVVFAYAFNSKVLAFRALLLLHPLVCVPDIIDWFWDRFFVLIVSSWRRCKHLWDLGPHWGKSAIPVQSALLWISQPDFQNQSIVGLDVWRHNNKPNKKKNREIPKTLFLPDETVSSGRKIQRCIQFTMHFIELCVAETKPFVGSSVNMILTGPTCGQCSSSLWQGCGKQTPSARNLVFWAKLLW